MLSLFRFLSVTSVTTFSDCKVVGEKLDTVGTDYA